MSNCPVTLAQVISAEFKPMSKQDYDSYAGTEYDGYTAEIEYGPGVKFTAIMDHGPVTTDIQVFDQDSNWWTWTIPTEPEAG